MVYHLFRLTVSSEKEAKLSQEKYLAVLGALIIILAGSLLYVGRNWDLTTNRWFIASILIGVICGLAFNKKNLAKTSAIYLAILSIMGAIMIVITRDYWMNSCFGGLVPPMILLLPLLTALVVYAVSALILYIVRSMNAYREEKKIF